MSERAAKPLFIDTAAFYARFDASAPRHERAVPIFERIGTGELPYRPLYTSTYVLDELATLVLNRRDHAAAWAALLQVLESGVAIVHPDEEDFSETCGEFARYDDHEMSFTDHMSGVLASNRDIEHVFTFDAHFRALDFTVVPEDTGE